MAIVKNVWRTRPDGTDVYVSYSDKFRKLRCVETGVEYGGTVHYLGDMTFEEIVPDIHDWNGARTFQFQTGQVFDTGDTAKAWGRLWVATADGVTAAPGDDVEGWEEVTEIFGIPDYVASKTYNKGDIVIYNTVHGATWYSVYRCLEDGVQGIRPEDDKWEWIWPSKADYPPFADGYKVGGTFGNANTAVIAV